MTEDSAIKHQRRFAKYERELLRCGGDIQALERFVKAQTVAFRKITKKYKVWHHRLRPMLRLACTDLAEEMDRLYDPRHPPVREHPLGSQEFYPSRLFSPPTTL